MSEASRTRSALRWPILIGCLVILVAVAVAYRNTLGNPLVFDDIPSLLDNPSLDSLGSSLRPPNREGMTVAGRPLLNLSLALNRAFSGENFRAYRVTNLGIHAGAAMLLLLVLARAFRLADPARSAPADWLAAGVALLWALHPLNTESVTYLVQRAESLAGLFYFLALLGFLVACGPGKRRLGAALAIAACFLGVATKETVATAPLVMLLFDRAFVAGSFAAALKVRGKLYAGAVSSWILLAGLVAATAGRGTSAGYDSGASTWHYLLTQSTALLTYIRLTFMPSPLVFDYGADVVNGLGAVLPQCVVCGVVLGGTGYLLVRNTALGFLAGAYLLILAPTSSFVPVATQAMAEHRTYPALVFLLLFALVPLWQIARTWVLCLLVPVTVVFGTMTYRRNADYATALGLWADTAAKRPTNSRAFFSLGNLLLEAGRADDALRAFRTSVGFQTGPNDAELNGVGRALLATGDIAGAIVAFQAAMNVEPRDELYPTNLGVAYTKLGDSATAITWFRRALALNPQHGPALYQLANLLMQSGQVQEALALYQRAETAVPRDPLLHLNYGVALGRAGDFSGAGAQLEIARTLAPRDPGVLFALGCQQAVSGKLADAQESFVAAIAIDPDHLPAHGNLAEVYRRRGQPALARQQYLEVLRLDPQNAVAREALARLGE